MGRSRECGAPRLRKMRALRILRAEPLVGSVRFCFVYRGKERMVEMITQVNNAINGVVWGPFGLALLFCTGFWMSARTGFFQFRKMGYWLRHTIGAIFTNKDITAHSQQGGYGHQPVPEHVHGAGGHHRHRQHRGCGNGHRFRWAGSHLLDVGHGIAWHDDQLFGECAGRVLPPQKRKRRVVGRCHVLPHRWSWRKEGLQTAGQGAGSAVCLLLHSGFLRHWKHEPDQFHRGQHERCFWRTDPRHRPVPDGGHGPYRHWRFEARCRCYRKSWCRSWPCSTLQARSSS